MIFLDGYDYGTTGTTPNGVHGTLVDPPYERQEVIYTYWQVTGASIHYSKDTVRVLTCKFTIENFADEATLRAHVEDMQSHRGDYGTLYVNGKSWEKCSFRGFTPSGPPLRDGSGVHGWVQFGRLAFRQIAS